MMMLFGQVYFVACCEVEGKYYVWQVNRWSGVENPSIQSYCVFNDAVFFMCKHCFTTRQDFYCPDTAESYNLPTSNNTLFRSPADCMGTSSIECVLSIHADL